MAPPVGFKHSQETRQKMLASHTLLSGSNHPMFGRKHAKEEYEVLKNV